MSVRLFEDLHGKRYLFKRTTLPKIWTGESALWKTDGKLHSLFGLCTVPTWTRLIISVTKSIFTDWLYVCRNEPRFRKRLSLLANVPILNSVAIYAQYRGARDQRLLRNTKIEGV